MAELPRRHHAARLCSEAPVTDEAREVPDSRAFRRPARAFDRSYSVLYAESSSKARNRVRPEARGPYPSEVPGGLEPDEPSPRTAVALRIALGRCPHSSPAPVQLQGSACHACWVRSTCRDRNYGTPHSDPRIASCPAPPSRGQSFQTPLPAISEAPSDSASPQSVQDSSGGRLIGKGLPRGTWRSDPLT